MMPNVKSMAILPYKLAARGLSWKRRQPGSRANTGTPQILEDIRENGWRSCAAQ